METAKPVPGTTPPPPGRTGRGLSPLQTFLRFLLVGSTLTAVLVMVTSKQTKLVPVPALGIRARLPAKFTNSPALIYLVVALSVACLYAIISLLASLLLLRKPALKLLLLLALMDALMLGIVASATGAAGSVAYIGLKGNKHTGWGKICGTYDKFCRYIGASLAVSLVSAILLLLLTLLSILSLYRRIHY